MNISAERLVPKDKKDPFYLEHLQRYQFAKKYIKSQRVLDLGCGVGYGSAELIKLGAKKVVGVDIDPKAIEYAQKRFINSDLRFRITNATKLPFKNQEFDVIVSFEVIEHIKDYKEYLNEVMRVLKKDGYFIFSTPNANGIRAGTSPYHYKEFTAKELKSLFLELGLRLELSGQFFENQDYIDSQKDYFARYNKLTFGGNKIFKKILHLVSPEFKTSIYKFLWPSKNIIINNPKLNIKPQNLNDAVTLIGVAHKP